MPLKTNVIIAFCWSWVIPVSDLVFAPHKLTITGFLTQWVLFSMAFFVLGLEPPYDLEIDNDGIRIVRNNRVKRNLTRERVRYAKESGWGPYRGLVVSENSLGRFWFRSIVIPKTIPEFEQIKARVVSWVEHRESIPA